LHQTLLGLLPFAVSSSSPNVSPSINDVGLTFGDTKPVLRIDALLLNVATPDVVGEVLEELDTFFNLSFEPDNRFELDILFYAFYHLPPGRPFIFLVIGLILCC
jgi:hypothetical protein